MRPTLKDVIVGTAAAIMVASCSGRQPDSATSPRVSQDDFTAGSVAGVWARPITVPGAGESMTLEQSGNHVTGSGTYSIEAGRSGASKVEGDFAGKTLTLTITRDYGLREMFVGGLKDATHLSGTLATEFGKGDVSYVKQ